MSTHEILGKRLTRFQTRRGTGGPNDLQSTSLEFIDNALSQRTFRADNSQIDSFETGKLH